MILTTTVDKDFQNKQKEIKNNGFLHLLFYVHDRKNINNFFYVYRFVEVRVERSAMGCFKLMATHYTDQYCTGPLVRSRGEKKSQI